MLLFPFLVPNFLNVTVNFFYHLKNNKNSEKKNILKMIIFFAELIVFRL